MRGMMGPLTGRGVRCSRSHSTGNRAERARERSMRLGTRSQAADRDMMMRDVTHPDGTIWVQPHAEHTAGQERYLAYRLRGRCEVIGPLSDVLARVGVVPMATRADALAVPSNRMSATRVPGVE